MAGDGADFQQCDQAKRDADTCEGKGRDAIEEGKSGSHGQIIVILVNHGDYESRRHTQNRSFLSQLTIVTHLESAIYAISLALNRPKYLSL